MISSELTESNLKYIEMAKRFYNEHKHYFCKRNCFSSEFKYAGLGKFFLNLRALGKPFERFDGTTHVLYTTDAPPIVVYAAKELKNFVFSPRENMSYYNSVIRHLNDIYYHGKYAESFIEKCKEFAKYVEENNTIEINTKKTALGRWVMRQRVRCNSGLILDWQIDLLDRIGFDWDPNKSNHGSTWKGNYKKLIAFKLLHGHMVVSRKGASEDRSLGHWVYHQRVRLRKENISKEEWTMLNKIGFWEDRAA